MDTEMIVTEDLILKAIAAYNGNLHNGMTKALEAVVALVLEEAAKVAVDFARYDAAAAIRALKEKSDAEA